MSRRLFAGVQFHPEVIHTEGGQQLLQQFLHQIAGLRGEWTTANVIAEQVDIIRAQAGSGKVICGLRRGGFCGRCGTSSARSEIN